MICPWCDLDYPVEFFETHHRNHVHNDDRPENQILICVKCHKRHHFESGYDTIIIKKDEYKPKTMEELMIDIDREAFLKKYRENQEALFHEALLCKLGKETLTKWISDNASHSFEWNKDEWRENVMKK